MLLPKTARTSPRRGVSFGYGTDIQRSPEMPMTDGFSAAFAEDAEHLGAFDDALDITDGENSLGSSSRRIEQLERGIAYRDLLLEEIIHRIKNQLQCAVSFLDEEVDAASSPEARRMLRRIKQQFLAYGKNHDQIYGSVKTAGRALSPRLCRMCAAIQDEFGERAKRIQLWLTVADVKLARHQEVSLSLILRELVTNAFKHAFPGGRAGTISIELAVDDFSVCRLRVHDDGVGRSSFYTTSAGLALVEAFASGLLGSVDISFDQGTLVEVSFPLCV